MLCLQVKAAREDENEKAVNRHVVSGYDLMLEEVLVKLLGCFRGQVVDLAAYHEEDREEVLRDDSEDKCFECETMEKERDHVDQEYELKSPDFKAVGIECFVSSEMYNLVVYLPVESLGYPI